MTDVVAGRFALCDPIARGGSGTVWRAYDRKAAKFCAAKVLRRRDAGDLLRFVREQSVRVSHPNVLAPYSWAAEDAHVVIASDLVDGGSLSTLIGDHGPIAAATVARILNQLLEALQHVHAAGLVHRDVKPANMLLRATGRAPLHVMLGDFGLAMGPKDAHLTELGTVVGTRGYMAPEIMTGNVVPDPRQDLYAAGRVAIALLNGAEPWDHEPLLPQIAPGLLRDIVLALCAPNAAARPPSAAYARAALGRALDDPLPRQRDGTAIDVLHQLPPLSPAAVAEARGGVLEPVDLRVVEQGLLTGPVRARSAAGSTSVLPVSPRRARRRVLFVAGALVAAAAVGVPVGLALSGATGSGSSHGTGSSAGAGGAPVEVGAVCTWQEQGNREHTPGGTPVVCAAAQGSYVWTRR